MQAKKISQIYILREPFGVQAIRYVGQTTDIRARFAHHIQRRKLFSTHKNAWICSLVDRQLIPIMEVVARTTEPNHCERYWIARLRAEGCDLTNATDGGEGITMTPAIRRKIGEASKVTCLGRKHTPETKAKIRAANLGKKLSLETKAKISAAHIGMKPTSEGVANMRASQIGRKHSPDSIAKARAVHVGRKRHPESIERIRTGQLWRHLPTNRVAQLWLLACALNPAF